MLCAVTFVVTKCSSTEAMNFGPVCVTLPDMLDAGILTLSQVI